MKKKLILFVLLVTTSVFAQVGIGTADPKAALDIVSVTSGLIIPRVVNHTALTVTAAQAGMQVYNTTTKSIWMFDGTAWIENVDGIDKSKWTNETTAPSRIQLTNFSDGITPRTAYTELAMTDAGNLGVGTTAPGSQLDVRTNFSNSDIARIGSTSQRIAIGVSAANNGPYVTTNSGTNGSLRLGVNGGEHMRIDASTAATVGNVGIGVGNAIVNHALQIHRPGVTEVYQQFTSGQVGSLATDGLKIGISSTGAASIQNLEATSLSLHTNATERVTILSNGNVGINETNPQHKLSINGGLSLGNGSFGVDTNYADDNNYIAFKDNNGSASEDFIGYKDGIFNFRDSPGGADTSQPNVIVWGKLGVGTSDFSSLPGTGLVIGNTGAQALGIKDGGDIAIYSPNNGSSASFYVDDGTSNTLTLNSNGKIFNFNGTGGSVSSDIRLKQDIVKVDNCLDKILKINGYSYRFKTNANDPHKEYGVVAQELLEVLPEAVYKNKDGFYSVSYSSLVPILVNAMKEQQEEIATLKTLVNDLINKK